MSNHGCQNYQQTIRQSRRDWLTVGSLTGLGLCLGDFLRMKSAHADRKWYGHYGQPYGSQAGMRMLLARRLVEAGARFVSLTFGGWDTHVQLREVYEKQMPPLDNAIAMLIKDLDNRGMLDSTLVWVVSEFGRTPKVNASAGRDHWSRVFSIAMAGGGLQRGLFFGDSDATSSEPSKDPVPLKDLHATIYQRLGINSDKELMAPGDRPIEIVNEGTVVKDLLV